jgi:hypothetical protein
VPSILTVSRELALHERQFRSTGSFDGFLSSVPGDAEGLGQVQSSVIQRQPMDGSPEIKRVALRTAVLLKEASESIFAEMHRKRPFLVPRMAVHGTVPAPLRTTAAQMTQQIQMLLAPQDRLRQQDSKTRTGSAPSRTGAGLIRRGKG